MKGSFLQRTDRRLRHLLPAVTTASLVFIVSIPLGLPNWAPIAPLLPLVAVYYWSVYRPDLMTAPAAFALGVLGDVVSGGPLGVGSLILLFVQGLTVSQRRLFLGKSFLIGWLGFALIGGAAVFAQWLLTSLLYGRFSSGHAVLFEMAMTLSFYPPLSWTLTRAQLALLRDV